MTETIALYQLLAWSSQRYPGGAFSYSHGLEWAVRTQSVIGLSELIQFASVVLSRGAGWFDAVLFAHAWRAADDPRALDELCELACALRESDELSVQCRAQDIAFLQVTCTAWPDRALDALAARQCGRGVAHSIVVGVACAVHGMSLDPALHTYIHAVAANLVATGTRLIPITPMDARIALAQLGPLIDAVNLRARAATLEDLGVPLPTQPGGLPACHQPPPNA